MEKKIQKNLEEKLEDKAILYVSLKVHNDSEWKIGMDCYKAGYKAALKELVDNKIFIIPTENCKEASKVMRQEDE